MRSLSNKINELEKTISAKDKRMYICHIDKSVRIFRGEKFDLKLSKECKTEKEAGEYLDSLFKKYKPEDFLGGFSDFSNIFSMYPLHFFDSKIEIPSFPIETNFYEKDFLLLHKEKSLLHNAVYRFIYRPQPTHLDILEELKEMCLQRALEDEELCLVIFFFWCQSGRDRNKFRNTIKQFL